ncbi:hypothetical protein MFIFM68171_01942 [Madurella fahalii]|uniref:Uncharacterized protein n=1 Tax=Madurella fahalii TaxID=1157608 RepID=A0ABQ0G1W1_9PEZI
MDQTTDIHLPPTIARSDPHTPLQPVPASELLDHELARKEQLRKKGNLMIGCRELDEYVLLGGFERGSVVGVSAEEEDIGLSIGLQTAANLVAERLGKALIITTLPVTVLLPKLQKLLVSSLQEDPRNLKTRVQECLERISISRVFDIEGLWQVLGELEETSERMPLPVTQGTETGPKRDAATSEQRVQQRTEVQDSEEEDSLSLSESPHPQSPTAQPRDGSSRYSEPPRSSLPDLILITHTSALLSTLFAARDKPTAHETTALLSSHLQYLTRSPAFGNPLVILLNSTTSPLSQGHDDIVTITANDEPRQAKFPEPTHSSIFSPPPQVTYPPGHTFQRNKPSFGQVFAQMLDLHLLCTRVPRTNEDAAAAVAGLGLEFVSYVWVVEVLLDEIGVYERTDFDDYGVRRNREQRWGAVDVDELKGGRVVDALEGRSQGQ